MTRNTVEPPGTLRLSALPPLSLYVHIPWCVRKCPYCDFNSHERPGELPEREYIDALIADLERALPAVWGRRIVSIFIGGGTPSLFAPQAIDRLLSEVRARLPVEPGAEVTLEANPGTLEAARFEGFRQAGINRLSVGVQSLDDRMLQALGRIHSASDARRGLELSLKHFDNVNADLMYGLPGQTLAMALADIEALARMGVPHVSAYQLTLEPNTVFWRRPPKLPEHDLCADMQAAIEATLGGMAFEHYETSAFAKPGRRCRHNMNYWEFGDYLGIGAGAHGKLSFPGRITRHSRARQPREYLAGAPGEERVVSPAELPFEFMLNALRLVQGFETELFTARTGLPITVVERELEAAERDGLLERDWKRIRPSGRGQRFLNALLERFLGDEKTTRG